MRATSCGMRSDSSPPERAAGACLSACTHTEFLLYLGRGLALIVFDEICYNLICVAEERIMLVIHSDRTRR